MNKSKTKATEEELRILIEGISQIFSHIVDKDYFLEVYQTTVTK